MAKKKISEAETQLRLENQELRVRLAEANETLDALRKVQNDANLFHGSNGKTIYSLTSAETPFRIMIEVMNEGFVTLSADGTILFCNLRFAQLVSVPHEQILGTNISQFIAENEHEKFVRILKTAIEKSCNEEIFYLTPQGDTRHFQLSFSPLPPSVLGDICLMISDNTALKKTERRLFEEEVRFRTIFENAPALIDAFDKDGCCTLWNKECEKTFGWTIDEINSHDVPFSLFYPDPSIRAQVMTSVTSGPEKIFREWNPQTKDGTVLTCMWADFFLPDGNEISLGYDISERKLAEKALKESELKYRELVENSPDAIVIYVDGIIVLVNKEGFNLLEAANAEELIGKPVMQFVHPDYRDFVISRMKKIANNEIVLPLVEEKFLRTDGSEIEVEVKAMPVKIDNKPGVQLIIRDITERKRVELALRKSEEKWRTIFEILPVGISILDKNGNISEHNRSLEKIMELTYDELQEQNYIHRKYFYYEDGEMSADELPSHKSVQEQKIIRNVEVGVGEEGGNIIWTEVSAAPLNLPDTICAVVTVDITNHKKLENELKRSELLLNNSQQLTHVGGWEWDVEKQFMYWTNEMYSLFDLDPDKYVPGIPGRFDLHLEGFRPENRKKIRAAFKRCLEKGESYDMEFPFTTSTGRPMWIRMMAKPVYKNGKVVKLTGFIMDINERKLFEKELMEREVNYSVLFNTVKQSIYIQKPDLTFINVNQGAVDMYGYEKEYFIGKTPEFLSDPERNDLKQISEHFKLAFQGQPQKYEFWGKKKNGAIFPKEIWTVKGKYFGEDVLISLAIDITERKQAEAQIQCKNEELQKLNAEKDKFFSIIAHDLRGPLSGFMGLTELMAGSPDMSPIDFHKTALIMKNSATNLFNLLGNLLEWSRLQRGLSTFIPTAFLLMTKITEFMALIQDAADKKEIAINYNIPDDLEVYADANMLATVIRNLGSNAVKFTRKGGRINISARSTSKRLVEISVQDTGIGINKEMIDHLFELDVKTNRKGTEGEYSTGLGLIICKDFIEKHGGKLWVESEEGKGSIFRFTLPLDSAHEPITKRYDN